jgi:hypothetical protein
MSEAGETRAPLRDSNAAKSESITYVSSQDSFRRIQEATDVAQREATVLLGQLQTWDEKTLRRNFGLVYFFNCVLIAASSVMVFFAEMISMRGVLIGSVTTVALVISLIMILQERGVQAYGLAQLAEKYCLLLTTAPGRAGLVIVLGMLVVSCNWLGSVAFWVSLLDCCVLLYACHTHPWFKENADNPLLFRTLAYDVKPAASDGRVLAE